MLQTKRENNVIVANFNVPSGTFFCARVLNSLLMAESSFYLKDLHVFLFYRYNFGLTVPLSQTSAEIIGNIYIDIMYKKIYIISDEIRNGDL